MARNPTVAPRRREPSALQSEVLPPEEKQRVAAIAVSAELYRGAGHNQLVDACLSREEQGLMLRDTDRTLARLVGGILTSASIGAEVLADAHVVATGVEAGRALILTTDSSDTAILAARYGTPTIEHLS